MSTTKQQFEDVGRYINNRVALFDEPTDTPEVTLSIDELRELMHGFRDEWEKATAYVRELEAKVERMREANATMAREYEALYREFTGELPPGAPSMATAGINDFKERLQHHTETREQ